MSKTLDEILAEDLGVSTTASQEKVAAENQAAEGDDIEKLAMEIGLLEEAAPATEAADQQEQGQKKEASMLNELFNDMFPADAPVAAAGNEKVASEEKNAAEEKEAAMGALAFDEFAGRVDDFVTGLAKKASDAKPAPTMKDNEAPEGKIDTTPQIDNNAIKAQKGSEVVGEQSQIAPAGNGEMDKKAAALRKAWIVASLEE